MPDTELLDCLVVGGGPGGLVAAVYLGRYRRQAVVIDAGQSRLARIPRTRNVIGFPDGIEGEELLDRLREQAARFGTRLVSGRVDSLSRLPDGSFEARVGEECLRARYVILATGAQDVEPEVTGLAPSLAAGRVRYCPVCDGFETQGQRVAVLGHEIHGLRESAFVAGFSQDVTWLSMGSHAKLPQAELERLEKRGVRIAPQNPRHIRCAPESGVTVEMHDGTELEFDVIYPALGMRHASGLATALGARANEQGQLEVDAHLHTSVDGLYAVGDVVQALHQINVAAGHAAIAATAVHNRLLAAQA